jgi:regulator of sirC expression with transglutaminase-like and TPR domain
VSDDAPEFLEPPEKKDAPSQVEALIRLLGDEDSKICSVVWDHLEKVGEAALPALERATRQSADGRVRAQAGRFLKEWSRREVFRKWVSFAKGEPIDLEEGAFLIAQTEYPGTDMGVYRKTLDHYAQVLHGRLVTVRTTDEAVRKISAFLFTQMGFKGNAAEYHNPENSYLNRVFDLKTGIPISLASIFLLAARRVAVPVHGVGMPQHFLLKYRGTARDVFIDAFHGGKLLSVEECARFLADAHIPFREDYLRVVSDREILIRMLGNLLRIYLSQEDQRRYDRISAMLKLLG